MGARGCAPGNRAPAQLYYKNVWKSTFLESSILACSARAIARAPILFLPINCLSNLDAFWLPGRNRSSKTRSCKSPWNLKKNWKMKKNWKFFKNPNFFQKCCQLRCLWNCPDFWVFELRLQPSSQKASKMLGECIGAHHMGERAVARPETALPPNCITKMFENPLFLSLSFWRAARAQHRVRPYNLCQWIVWVI